MHPFALHFDSPLAVKQLLTQQPHVVLITTSSPEGSIHPQTTDSLTERSCVQLFDISLTKASLSLRGIHGRTHLLRSFHSVQGGQILFSWRSCRKSTFTQQSQNNKGILCSAMIISVSTVCHFLVHLPMLKGRIENLWTMQDDSLNWKCCCPGFIKKYMNLSTGFFLINVNHRFTLMIYHTP